MIKINTLRPFAAWATRLWSDPFASSVVKLAVKYALFLLFVQILTSLVIYAVFMVRSGLVIGDGPFVGVFDEQNRFHESSEILLHALLWTNLIIWSVGVMVSSFFAYFTLLPLKRMYTEQRTFISDLAHEIRTPLSIIQAAAESIDGDSLAAKDIVTEVNHLEAITNDLLILLKGSTAETKSEELVNFSDIVSRSVKRLERLAKSKNISIQLDIAENCFVYGETEKLRRIIDNLLKNAITYTPEGGQIVVALNSEGTTLELVVTNTGPGIPPADLPHIFDRFYRATNATTKENGGTGLGLAIVKSHVEDLGGIIKAESKDHLTTFTVTFHSG